MVKGETHNKVESSSIGEKSLNLRTYDCPPSGLSIDRDLNASINLKNAVGQDP
ncbi:MAG: transposase [Okeania sp. SIO3C4]|nr:transposase [Okeania sp. SIO3B3]NER02558.1 transposase [Okeania sp. SIO3C4]